MIRLLIDPGHGLPFDPGASANGIVEAALVTTIAAKLHTALAGIVDVVCTRDATPLAEKLTLERRAMIGRDAKVDMVLSIHANAATPNANGLLAFHWPDAVVGQVMARAIQEEAPARLAKTMSDGSARTDPYPADQSWPRVRNVLRMHHAPAVLVECGFLTNLQDAAALEDPAVQAELVAAMVLGIQAGIAAIGEHDPR